MTLLIPSERKRVEGFIKTLSKPFIEGDYLEIDEYSRELILKCLIIARNKRENPNTR